MKNSNWKDFKPGDFVDVYSGGRRYTGLLLALELPEEGQLVFPPMVTATILIDGFIKSFDVWEGDMHLVLDAPKDSAFKF